jgi:hypothetical protein
MLGVQVLFMEKHIDNLAILVNSPPQVLNKYHPDQSTGARFQWL